MKLIRTVMSIAERVVLRATISGLSLAYVSFRFLERSDPMIPARGLTIASSAACAMTATAGLVWIGIAIRTIQTRGLHTLTWRMHEHVAAVVCSTALFIAAAITLSPTYGAMGASALIASILDIVNAFEARSLVSRFGLERAAIEYEALAGSRKAATKNALSLLSVQDEVGNELADEVLCGIPLPEISRP